MAKKGQPVQLQTEITSDEEWEKLLEKDGLIVVDIFSDWCGPCAGMLANLKKIKLEIGGDLLQLAIARCDQVEALARFRTKSEPTWMFISKGKMVNFLYGADAPKLMRVIADELKKEQDSIAGTRERTQVMDISEMADPERVRFEAAQQIIEEARLIEEEKKANELRERRTAECHNILDALPNLGVILIFPNAVTKYKEVLPDIFQEAGLVISQTDKVLLTEEKIEELFYFANEDEYLPEDTLKVIYEKDSVVLLVKVSPMADDLTVTMEEELLDLIYGPTKRPPGDEECVFQKLLTITEEQIIEKKVERKVEAAAAAAEEEEGEEGEGEKEEEWEIEEKEEKEEEGETEIDIEIEIIPSVELMGIWTPPSDFIKAVSLKLFFPRAVETFLIPEPEPIPPYYIIAFDVLHRRDILRIAEKYTGEVLRYGFFTSEVPEEAELLAKSLYKYEKKGKRTAKEKLILQVAKRKSECLFTLVQMAPTYISANTVQGAIEAKIFFPEEYDEPLDEEEENYVIPDDDAPVGIETKAAEVEDEELEGEEELDEEEMEEEGEGEEDYSNLDTISDFPSIVSEEIASPPPPPPPLDEPPAVETT